MDRDRVPSSAWNPMALQQQTCCQGPFLSSAARKVGSTRACCREGGQHTGLLPGRWAAHGPQEQAEAPRDGTWPPPGDRGPSLLAARSGGRRRPLCSSGCGSRGTIEARPLRCPGVLLPAWPLGRPSVELLVFLLSASGPEAPGFSGH